MEPGRTLEPVILMMLDWGQQYMYMRLSGKEVEELAEKVRG